MKNTAHTRGVSIVEAIVVVSIMGTAFVATLGAAATFLKAGLLAADKTQGLYLLEEGVEIVRHLRDEGYSTNITPNIGTGIFYLAPTAGGWEATTTNVAVLGSFTRTVELTGVHRRNSDDDIVPSSSGDPKTVDPGTARLEVSVSTAGWSTSITTYVSDIYEN